MPSSSGQSETKDRESPPDPTANSETTHDDQPRETTSESPASNQLTNPGQLHEQVRIVTLEAEVALHERERIRFKQQITRMESEIEALEKEIATLEDTIAWKDRHRQQVINQYEQVVSEKDRAYQTHRSDFNSTPVARSRSTVAAIQQAIEYLRSRL